MYLAIWASCVGLTAISIVTRNVVTATLSVVFALAFYGTLPLLGDVKNAYVLTLSGRSYDHMEVGFVVIMNILINQLSTTPSVIFNFISSTTFALIALATIKIISSEQKLAKRHVFFILPCIAFSQVFFLFSENILRQGLSVSIFLFVYAISRHKTLTSVSLVFHKSSIVLFASFVYSKFSSLFRRNWFFYLPLFFIIVGTIAFIDALYTLENFATRNNDRFSGLMKPIAQMAYVIYLSRIFRTFADYKDIIHARELIVMVWFAIVLLGNIELASRLFVFVAALDLILAISAQLKTQRNRLNKAFFVVTCYNLASPSVYVMLK